jgi:hypothetical protein
VSLKFLQAGLLPLTGFRLLLRVPEGPWLSDGGKVGISSGVEGVISSRVIGVIIGVRGAFLLILIILSWRALSRTRVFIIRGDSRSGISVLLDSWR